MIDDSAITIRGRTNIRRGKLFKPEFIPTIAKPYPEFADKDIPPRINIPGAIAVPPAAIMEDDYFELTSLVVFQFFDIEQDRGGFWIIKGSKKHIAGDPNIIPGIDKSRRSSFLDIALRQPDGKFPPPTLHNFRYAGFRVSYYISTSLSPFSEGSQSDPCYIYNGQYCFYPSQIGYYSQGQYFQLDEVGSSIAAPRKPNYRDLITGYYLDQRVKNNNPIVVPDNDEDITIGYYRQNKLEPLPNLTTIDWFTYDLKLKKGIPYQVPIVDVVLGTLTILKGSDSIKNILTAKDNDPNLYPIGFRGCEDELISHWRGLRNQNIFPAPEPAHKFAIVTLRYTSITNEYSRMYRCSAANNNVWRNRPTKTKAVKFERYYNFSSSQWVEHPMFTVDNERAYKWHIEPQVQGVGTLIMDSPILREIHAALDAGNYAINSLDKTKPRISNLGHLIEKISFLLGYRPEQDGSFDPTKEKARLRKVISDKDNIDTKKIGVNNFGSDGMIVKRLSNRFDKDKIVSDECVIVKDVLQLISEYHDQLNLAIGIQESSAIEIRQEDNISRYPNQLALLIELLNLASSNHDMTRANLISSMVTQGQTSEIIGGLGLPSITKTIPIAIDGKTKDLPYKGIAPHRSISQEVATCTANVGIILGQII